MIILDTSILRSFAPDSSSADLLLAIRATGAQRVGVPWMVVEELAAQQAIKYREKYQAAAHAVESLRQVTPWQLSEDLLGTCAEDDVRNHWREKWGDIVQTIPTSDAALREAAFREANCLPPCKTSKGEKTGSRDAAIWLSAVEYARQNPTETVYFTSANTRDFGDGSPYPSPMCDDLKGIEGRFVHWTDLDQAVTEFAKPVMTDGNRVAEILRGPAALSQVGPALEAGGHFPMGFDCTAAMEPGEWWVFPAHQWRTHEAAVGEIVAAQMYRIGDQEWCAAKVRWYLTGVAVCEVNGGVVAAAGCAVTASMLFAPDIDVPRLTVLRADLPQQISVEILKTLSLPPVDWTPAEMAAARLGGLTGRPDYHPYRQPRAYEGAVLGIRPTPESLKLDHHVPPGG